MTAASICTFFSPGRKCIRPRRSALRRDATGREPLGFRAVMVEAARDCRKVQKMLARVDRIGPLPRGDHS
ncbi:hypothetical protein WL92_09375 [Burkholderia multivorans]|nr:hypothetical protein WL92_09375 [Burkholderia multivorans]